MVLTGKQWGPRVKKLVWALVLGGLLVGSCTKKNQRISHFQTPSLPPKENPFEVITEPVTVEKIIQYLQDHPEITTIDAFLPALPESYRSQYTLMHTSRSDQEAKPHHPRVIFFGHDSRLLMAFNSAEQDNGKQNMLELIQYRDESRKFDFYSIEFPGQKAFGQLTVAENPIDCFGCHSSDLRPNWDPYSIWVGAYFGNDDEAETTEEERRNIKTFLETAPDRPRYQHLVASYSDYLPPEDDTFRTRIEHNSTFTARISALNFKRTARILRARPNYKHYKYAILGSALCFMTTQTDFYPAPVKQTFEGLIWESDMRNLPVLLKTFDGMEASQLSMAFEPERFSLNTPGSPNSEFLGELVLGDPELLEFAYIDHSFYHGTVRTEAVVPFDLNYDSKCDELARKSRSELSKISSPSTEKVLRP